MSRPWTATDCEGRSLDLDNLATQKHLEGHRWGAHVVAKLLLERATEAFAAKRDDEARLLRSLADEVCSKVIPRLDEEANRHGSENPYLCETEPPPEPEKPRADKESKP